MNDPVNGAPGTEDDCPRREWITRCSDTARRLSTCSVEANDGEVEIVGPNGSGFILGGVEIGQFRESFDAATRQVQVDIRGRE